ncbi:MAG: NADH-quinone oxidoreductase subunit A [Myxococcaceae bacterium]
MPPSPLAPYLPLAATLLVAGLMAAAIPLLAKMLGPRRPSAVKSASFECGSVSEGSARSRFAVKFYVVALLFIVFDIETVFLYPWAVNFKALGWFGYAEVAAFAATLLVGLAYVWKKGALEWET